MASTRVVEDSNVDYIIEITEIDPDDKDVYQVREQIEPTNYSADIIRILNEKEDVSR